jgi:hypothetical protein
MSEVNLMEQLKAAANEPDVSLDEYKEQRQAEAQGRSVEPKVTERYDERPRPYEKEVIEDKPEVEESEKEYKPWESETEKKDDEVEEDDDVIVTDSDKKVPLHKLLKLKAQKKEREAELERYRAQLSEYEAIIKKALPQEKADEIVDPIERKLKELKEPNSMDYSDYDAFKRDYDQYKMTVREIEEERVINKVRKSFEEEARYHKAQEELQKTVNSFVDRIEKASATNPDIKHAVGWFEKKIVENGVQNFDRNIQQSLVNDDNAPELILRVVKNKDLIKEIFEGGNTAQILKKIGRLSTFIELEKEDDDTPTYSEKPKKVVPRSLSGNQSGSTKDSSKADSMEEYKKLRKLEDMKNRRR